MKFGAITLCFNEEDFIGGCLDLLDVDVKVVVISDKTFQGEVLPKDKSEKIALSKGAIVIRCTTSDQWEMRNIGMALLEGMGIDNVFIVDADVFFEKEVLDKYKMFIERNPVEVYYAKKRFFFKRASYEAICPNDKGGILCLKSTERMDRNDPHYCDNNDKDKIYIPVEDLGYCYHFSYVRTPEKMKEKIKSFSHAKQVRSDWFEKVFMKFTPDMKCFSPTNPYDFTECKVVELPKEIKNKIPSKLW